MGEVISLCARRRLREIDKSILWVGEQRVDPIDEENEQRFREAQQRAMERVRQEATELCAILEAIRDVCREAQSDAPSSTT